MKTLTFPGCSKSNLKASRTESYPVSARENRSQRRSGQPEIQLQEKAFRSVKHRDQTSSIHATSVRSIANLYFLERRMFW
jgi:hypothetical protein